MPVNIPNARPANNRARKGWNLSFVDERTINRTHNIRTIINSIAVIN